MKNYKEQAIKLLESPEIFNYKKYPKDSIIIEGQIHYVNVIIGVMGTYSTGKWEITFFEMRHNIVLSRLNGTSKDENDAKSQIKSILNKPVKVLLK